MKHFSLEFVATSLLTATLVASSQARANEQVASLASINTQNRAAMGNAKSSSWWVPDYGMTHFGNYMGMLVAGAGYQVNHILSTDVYFSYTPKSISGEAMRHLGLKNTFNLKTWITEGGYRPGINLGIGALYGLHRALFLLLPDQYPDGYYRPSGLRFLIFGGLSMQINKNQKVYLEYSWFESQIERYYENPEYKKLWNAGTYGVGYRYYL